MSKIYASVFSADCLRLGEEIDRVLEAGADGLHIDIMDGVFVPLFGFNNLWMNRIGEYSHLPLDLHIMSADVAKILETLNLSRVKAVSIHLEIGGKNKLLQEINMIKSRGIQCGLAISPGTKIGALQPYLEVVDGVLVMSCLPGVENAGFLDATYDRIAELRRICRQAGKKDMFIGVDGGLDLDRAIKCMEFGADRAVLGRYLFRQHNPEEIFQKLHQVNRGEESRC